MELVQSRVLLQMLFFSNIETLSSTTGRIVSKYFYVLL
jgi:hypothetical protein